MDKKMFFLDLDGTALRDDKTIPEENVSAIREAVDAGHYAAIATGRSTVSAMPVARQLGMLREGCFLISYNGAKILRLDTQELIRELFLPTEYAAYLFTEAERYNLHIQAYSEDVILARRETPELHFYFNQAGMPYRIVPGLYSARAVSSAKTSSGFPDPGDVPKGSGLHGALSPLTPKVLVASLDHRELLEKFRADHREWESGRCVSFFSGPEYLEYCHMHGTKADGIAFFETFLGIAHENTVAMGDEENDLAMIRAAGIGVAMPNAAEGIRQYADYVPEHDNNTGGVAEVIRRCMTGTPASI
ncbi:MAG: Cof-type HAD-IIB family hydrolase [Lachnospiraceae bacterium]|nr:Cof-type HAD-IIB family hydrolase [Lachnospiraceae bacterium]